MGKEMKKRKVKRYQIGGGIDDNYERNENREGRMSTLDPSDIEDAIRGRQMTDTLNKIENSGGLRAAAETAGTNREDTGVGLLSGVKKPLRPAGGPPSRPMAKPPVAPPAASSQRFPPGPPPGSPAASSAAPTMSPISSGRGTMAGPTAAQIEEGRKRFAEDEGRRNLQRLQKEDKPLERVNPEANLMGGPALRGAKALGAALAGKMAARDAPAAAGMLGRSKGVGENLTKDMGPVEFAAGKRQMLQNQRGQGVITPPASVRPARGGGRDPGARRPTQDELDQMRMGSDFMRRGGKVKAHKSGGSVSSASKRADGIAIRGKTRGKYI